MLHLNDDTNNPEWVAVALPNQIKGTPIDTKDIGLAIRNMEGKSLFEWNNGKPSISLPENWDLDFPGNSKRQGDALESIANMYASALDINLSDQLNISIGNIQTEIDETLKKAKLEAAKKQIVEDVSERIAEIGEQLDLAFATVLEDIVKHDSLPILSEFQSKNGWTKEPRNIALAIALRSDKTQVPYEAMKLVLDLTIALESNIPMAKKIVEDAMKYAGKIDQPGDAVWGQFGKDRTSNAQVSFLSTGSRYVPADKLYIYTALEVAGRAAGVTFNQQQDGQIDIQRVESNDVTNITQVLTTLANTHSILKDSPITRAFAKIFSLNNTDVQPTRQQEEDLSLPVFTRQTNPQDDSFFKAGTLERVED